VHFVKKQQGVWLAAALCAVTIGAAVQSVAQDKSAPAAKAAQPEKAEIGKPFKDFTLRDIASDGGKQMVKLSSFKGKKAIVGIFMANRCGTTWSYEQKIGSLLKDYSSKGVAVMAIHSSYQEPDSEIVGQMEQRNLAMPILDDKQTQALAKYVGAYSTPTFFVVDKTGVLRYIGSFDKRGSAPAYVPDALNALLAGKDVAVKQTRAFG
jgi:peroxiredoxin